MLERSPLGNWASCLAWLGRNKRLASAKEGMQDRIERYGVNREDREHFDSGAYFSEDFNRVNGRILGARAKFNPLIPYSEQAIVKGHLPLTEEIKMNGKPASQLLEEIAEKDAKKPIWQKRVVDLGRVETHKVPTDGFADCKTIVWLAQGEKLANDYGLNFLREKLDIQEVRVYHAPLEGEDAAFGFWLYWLGSYYRSYFDCDYRGLDSDYGSVFGVPLKSAEGTSQKFRQEKVRIFQPSFTDVLNYTKPYVPEIVQSKFEKGLRKFWKKK